MILSPAVIALMLGSAAVGLLALYASAWGVRILRHWDLRSGSESQLQLEKRTYLVSTLMAWAFAFQVGSLFLFIFTAEDLHRLFVGAMCAAGTLNVNGFGYPTILLKVGNALLAGIWLIVNYTDNRASDYPLIRKKYAFLLVITPLLLAEAVLQGAYFAGLKANVITSCCGSLFGAEAQGPVSSLVGLPAGPMRAALIASLAITFASGLLFHSGRVRAGAVFSASSLAAFFISVAALVSFISPYIYELPTHHCPFCILQREYSYIGYFFYVSLLGGAIPGAAVGVLLPFRGIESLQGVLPPVLRRLVLASLLFYFLFSLIGGLLRILVRPHPGGGLKGRRFFMGIVSGGLSGDRLGGLLFPRVGVRLVLGPGLDRQGDGNDKSDPREKPFLPGWRGDGDNAETSPASARKNSLPSGERMSRPGARKRAARPSRAVEVESFSFGVVMCGSP